MVKQLVFSVFLAIFASACYYVPTFFASSKGIDIGAVPVEYYNHHAWRTSGQFLLTAVYAGLFLWFVPERLLVVKIFSCHLFIMETISFFWHVITMIFKTGYSINQIVLNTAILSLCCVFFLSRAIYKQTGDEFKPNRTYIIKTKPKNIIGFLNYLVRRSGHNSIYQDGYIYGFKRSTGEVEKIQATYSSFANPEIVLKEIPKSNDIDSLIGKRYSILKFNCNHLIKHATGT